MSDLSATIRLRPVRIALLVRPANLSAIRTFMRICTCLWGGEYNPIIPVFRSQPKDWRTKLPEHMTGAEISRGYVEFFEPDAFVESEPNLLEKIGLGALRDTNPINKRVVLLRDLLTCQSHHDWSELALGLNIFDVMKQIYKSEQRFELRNKRPAYIVKSHRNTALVEAVFGLYPTDKPSSYIAKAYNDVFKPLITDVTPETWSKVFNQGAVTPLNVTSYKLEKSYTRNSDLLFYVFDPAKSTDLIDLWNLRLEPRPVLPIPVDWWTDLVNEVSNAIADQYRPLQGNPHGVMHHTTIEFSRSVDDSQRNDMLIMLNPDLPQGSWDYKTSRNRIWNRYENEYVVPKRPLRITAKEKRITLAVRDNETLKVDFQALDPDFASLYGGGHNTRWVNVVNLTAFRSHVIATVFPFNVTDMSWPRLDYLGKPVVVGTEGWSFSQQYKDSTQIINLLNHEEAVIGSLKRLGVEASLSEPGHIAKQVLHHLGGIWGIRFIADQETLKLLNKMAGGLRKRVKGNSEIEEVFEHRTSTEQEWKKLVAQHNQQGLLSEMSISQFTDRNVIRLGLTTKCPHCTEINWHSLITVDYKIICDRCIKAYTFPQGEPKANNVNWSYRVIGPFSTPDYARGSYGALLALRVLNNLHLDLDNMSFSTALNIKVDDGPNCEADYVAWISHQSLDENIHPKLVIGEAKSLGDGDLIKSHDLKQLRRIAKKLPGAIIVISVMRDKFTQNEKRTLLPFVKWARRLDNNWVPTNPVILLTGVELFHQFNLNSTWKEKGGLHAEHENLIHTRSLLSFAEATQSIYLGLPAFSEDFDVAMDRRRQSAFKRL